MTMTMNLGTYLGHTNHTQVKDILYFCSGEKHFPLGIRFTPYGETLPS